MKTKQLILLSLALTIVLLLGILAMPAKADSIKDEKIISNDPPTKLDLYLDRLVRYECDDCGPRFRRLDSNGKFSYGCLQFQQETFIQNVRRYDPMAKGKGDDDIMGRIYECKYQKQIARQMFLADAEGAAQNWYTTIYKRGLGLPVL